jgi:predicted adenine nucleotide alpha hydrolase (AANH) superfamily ATPase
MAKLLLHTCCAPCSIAIIDELRDKYALTVFFYNPNIFPEAEYLKRKGEVIKVCTEWGIPMFDADYEPAIWDAEILGLEDEAEGGLRCPLCFALRLRRTAEYAGQNGFDAFATSLTTGRNKKAEVINPIGERLAEEFKIIYLSEDWKTNGRQEKSKKMVGDRGIYRQNYCGCKYSKLF